ncbi:MAG: hypothetical protein WAT09_10600 [Paracoccaceae bacterium]
MAVDDLICRFLGQATIGGGQAKIPKDVLLFAVIFCVRYSIFYRDLKKVLAERDVCADHTTPNRWVAEYCPLIANTARRRKAATGQSWRIDLSGHCFAMPCRVTDETYIKLNGE